jgi:hypothetical protein
MRRGMAWRPGRGWPNPLVSPVSPENVEKTGNPIEWSKYRDHSPILATFEN